MLRVWLRRCVLLAVTAAAFAVAPATADPVHCSASKRPVYAVTTAGGLVENMFCASPNRVVRWSGSRMVASSGWADTSAVFWSGESFGDGAYYRVSASGGALSWSRDLLSWQQVAASSRTDWRGFASLISTKQGILYGTEHSGVVRRWFHTGWKDGADTWGDNGVVVATLPRASRLLGHTTEGFIGVDGLNNGTVSAWSAGFVKTDVQIAAPVTVKSKLAVPFDLGQRYPTSAFAVTTAGRLAVLFPSTCIKPSRTWHVNEETGGGYRLVFPGGETAGGTPAEWQCV